MQSSSARFVISAGADQYPCTHDMNRSKHLILRAAFSRGLRTLLQARLEWPAEITETEFFRKVSSLPRVKEQLLSRGDSFTIRTAFWLASRSLETKLLQSQLAFVGFTKPAHLQARWSDSGWLHRAQDGSVLPCPPFPTGPVTWLACGNSNCTTTTFPSWD